MSDHTNTFTIIANLTSETRATGLSNVEVSAWLANRADTSVYTVVSESDPMWLDYGIGGVNGYGWMETIAPFQEVEVAALAFEGDDVVTSEDIAEPTTTKGTAMTTCKFTMAASRRLIRLQKQVGGYSCLLNGKMYSVFKMEAGGWQIKNDNDPYDYSDPLPTLKACREALALMQLREHRAAVDGMTRLPHDAEPVTVYAPTKRKQGVPVWLANDEAYVFEQPSAE